MTDLFTNELEWVTIKDLCKDCGKLPLTSSKRRNPWCRPQRLVIVSANSIFWLLAYEFFLYQSGLQGDYCGTCLLALSKWLLRRTKGLGNRAPTWYLPSLPAVFLTSTSWPLYCYPAAQEVLSPCFQCSQYRNLC